MAHARTQLLDKLLVLVELLELLNIHGIHTNAACLLAMLHITQDTKLHLGACHVRKLNRAAETLVLLGIIVLQANLELDGLSELPLLILRTLQDS